MKPVRLQPECDNLKSLHDGEIMTHRRDPQWNEDETEID